MQFTSEELSEIIYQLEGGFPITMDLADYLNMIDEMKAYKKIQEQIEDELLVSDLR